MLPVIGLGVLAFIGYIKAAPVISALPLDPTLVGAGIVALTVLAAAPRIFTARGIPPLVLLYLALLIGAAPVGISTDYSSSKTLMVITLVPLCMLGGRFILDSEERRFLWTQGIVGLGFAIAALTVLFPDDLAAVSGRLTIAEGNSIGSARGVGAAVVVLAIWALQGKRLRWLSTVTAGGLVVLMLLIGTRGPILAAAIAITMAVALSRQNSTPVRPLLAFLGVGAAAWVAINESDRFSGRLFTLQDNSTDARRKLWEDTARIVRENPLGIGWGQLGAHLRLGYRLDSGAVQYPHNLVLEVSSEAGWISGLIVVAVLVWALWVQWRATVTTTETVMFGLLVFAVISVMVSGDVTTNREVWVAVGAAMACLGADRSGRGKHTSPAEGAARCTSPLSA